MSQHVRIIAIAFAAAALAAPALAEAKTYVPSGAPDYELVTKPSSFWAGSGVACGVFKLEGLRWTRWTNRSARAKGLALFNDGDPDCAGGSYRAYQSRISLSRPRSGCRIYVPAIGNIRTDKRMFTRIKVRYSEGTFRSTTLDGQTC